jgi:hypothetical protein
VPETIDAAIQEETQMSDQKIVIDLEDETEGHKFSRGVVEPDDAEWLEERLRRDSGKTTFRVVMRDEGEDTEGHAFDGTTLRVSLQDEDDTEGHAIAIHFPSRADADAFRRRLLVTGVLVGSVALGTAGGIGLSALQSDADSAGTAGAAITQSGPMDVHEAPAFGVNVAPQVGPLDAHEAPAFEARAAAATQVGPLDAHEAPAFQQAAAAVDADRDLGIMDASGAPAATTQVGPLDAHEAPAFQSDATDEGNSEMNDIGGPTPR